MTNSDNPQKYFYKSKFYYKITFYGFIWVLLLTQVYKIINPIIASILIVVPVLGAFVIVPLGSSYLIKSFTNKEPFHKYRILYLIGYLFFALILLGLVVSLVHDISRFSK